MHEDAHENGDGDRGEWDGEGLADDHMTIIGDTVVFELNNVVQETTEGMIVSSCRLEVRMAVFAQLQRITDVCSFEGPLETLRTIIGFNGHQADEGNEPYPFDFFVEHPYLLREFADYEGAGADEDGFIEDCGETDGEDV